MSFRVVGFRVEGFITRSGDNGNNGEDGGDYYHDIMSGSE